MDRYVFLRVRFTRRDEPEYGTIVVELLHAEAPVTCRNFLGLVRGDAGADACYRNAWVTRSMPGEFVQMGRVRPVPRSLYGGPFPDEPETSLDHTAAGRVGMASRGPDTNLCEFYITTRPCPWMDRSPRCVFGHVVRGMTLLRFLNTAAVAYPSKRHECVIHECGVLDARQVEENFSDSSEDSEAEGSEGDSDEADEEQWDETAFT
jgi:cyclophilin family peptidyl-prolyl cis-trans isomerase